MMLSTHFSLEEFILSDAAVRRGLDNAPTKPIIENLRHLAEKLEDVRSVLGHPIIIKSGYRSPAVNAVVKGAKKSEHMDGRAADIICPAYGTPLQVAKAIKAAGIEYNQLIHEFGAWVHISVPVAGAAPKREELTYRSGKPVTEGLV